MLRNKYLLRNEGEDYTFHSVILAAVYDIKTLKLKIRSNEEHKYNSPWNIVIKENGELNIEKVIQRFQQFMKEQYSYRDTEFLE